MKKEFYSDQDAFDQICGNCHGLLVTDLIEDDIRSQAMEWGDCSDDMVDAAIRALQNMQYEATHKQ